MSLENTETPIQKYHLVVFQFRVNGEQFHRLFFIHEKHSLYEVARNIDKYFININRSVANSINPRELFIQKLLIACYHDGRGTLLEKIPEMYHPYMECLVEGQSTSICIPPKAEANQLIKVSICGIMDEVTL